MVNHPLTLVALGGNVLTRQGERGEAAQQTAHAVEICDALTPLIDSTVPLIITHGNGPQVGSLLLQNDAGQGLTPPMPLDVLVGESEGLMGDMLQQAMLNHLMHSGPKARRVVTLITHVLVDSDDPAFNRPTKPVGPFYSEDDARNLQAQKGWILVEDSGRGWRRVVPSPNPIEVLQRDSILELARSGTIVIALGGGGIPVVQDACGDYQGIEAVIDKDLASACLAGHIGVRRLLILTGVDTVMLDFNTPHQRPIRSMDCKQAEKWMTAGHFAAGSMKPKVQAALNFLKIIDGEVIITSPTELEDALHDAGGTRITR